MPIILFTLLPNNKYIDLRVVNSCCPILNYNLLSPRIFNLHLNLQIRHYPSPPLIHGRHVVRAPVNCWHCGYYRIPCMLCFFTGTHTLHSSSLAYSNCQHHWSCTSRLLLSKIRVIWTQALQHHNSWCDNCDSYEGTSGWEKLDQGMIHILSGTQWEGARFYHATQNSATI